MNRKEKIKEFYAKKHHEEKNQERIKEKAIILRKRINKDIKYRLWENAVSRIKKTYNNLHKLTYNELIGCNEDEFFEYIKTILFDPYTLDNYPEWEMDHIIGICNWNLNNVEEAKKCFNYTNIQILSKEDNLTKKKYINASSARAPEAPCEP
jgi:hypothetical protein